MRNYNACEQFSPRSSAFHHSGPNCRLKISLTFWANSDGEYPPNLWASSSGEYSPNAKDSKTGFPKELNCLTVLSEKHLGSESVSLIGYYNWCEKFPPRSIAFHHSGPNCRLKSSETIWAISDGEWPSNLIPSETIKLLTVSPIKFCRSESIPGQGYFLGEILT